MKIRNQRLIRTAGWLGARTAKLLVSTLDFEYRCLGDAVVPHLLPSDTPVRNIYPIWHENLILPTIKSRAPDVAALISKHADGQILGELIKSVGMGMVQGSTTRGGIEAVRTILGGNAGRNHLAITPDGPRGPRRVVQAGTVYLASRTGMTIVCLGIGYDRPWRAKSWDRFAVPRPWSRARLVCADAITVPPKLRTEGLGNVSPAGSGRDGPADRDRRAVGRDRPVRRNAGRRRTRPARFLTPTPDPRR